MPANPYRFLDERYMWARWKDANELSWHGTRYSKYRKDGTLKSKPITKPKEIDYGYNHQQQNIENFVHFNLEELQIIAKTGSNTPKDAHFLNSGKLREYGLAVMNIPYKKEAIWKLTDFCKILMEEVMETLQ